MTARTPPAPPAALTLGPHEYRIVDDDTGVAADVAAVRGACYPERLLVVLDAELPHTIKAATLLHEVVHALLDDLDLDEEVEETVARHLGPTLLDALRRNPALVTFLTG